MSVTSKVNDLVTALREEENRLREELAGANERVREIKTEIARVKKGLRGLSASNGAGGKGRKRKRKSAGSRETESGAPSVVESGAESFDAAAAGGVQTSLVSDVC